MWQELLSVFKDIHHKRDSTVQQTARQYLLLMDGIIHEKESVKASQPIVLLVCPGMSMMDAQLIWVE